AVFRIVWRIRTAQAAALWGAGAEPRSIEGALPRLLGDRRQETCVAAGRLAVWNALERQDTAVGCAGKLSAADAHERPQAFAPNGGKCWSRHCRGASGQEDTAREVEPLAARDCFAKWAG